MPRQIGPVRARFEYAPISGIVRMLAAVPLERAVKLGAAMGSMVARIDVVNRPIALTNLEIAFPDLAQRARLEILAGMYRNWGRMMAEWCHFDDFNRDNIADYVTYEGKEILDHAVRLGEEHRGFLVLTAHFGNIELLPFAHSIYDYRIVIVHRPTRNPLVDEQIARTRVKFGNEILDRKTAGPAILKYLRAKWQVAIALDLDVRRGVFVDFFGLKACTSDGMARIAMATGAPVVPAFMVREGKSVRQKITVLPMVEMVKTRDREECVRENTQRMTNVIEEMIRRYPDHWNWIHRRWKTRPPGEKRFY